MILPPLTDRALAELGGTGGGPDTLALLVRDQDTRRMLLLRAILEAADAAGPDVCPPAARERLRADWALLEAAEAANGALVRAALCHPLLGPWARRCLQALTSPAARPTGAAPAPGPAARATGTPPAPDTGASPGSGTVPHTEAGPDHGAVPHVGAIPHVGGVPRGGAVPHGGVGPDREAGRAADVGPDPEASRGADVGPDPDPEARPDAGAVPPAGAVPHAVPGPGARGLGPGQQCRELLVDLAHFSAVAAAVAARAGVAYAVRLSAHGGRLVLPGLGALRVDGAEPVAVDVVHRHGRLTLRGPGAADVSVFLEDGFGAWSDSRAWHPAYALPGLLPDGAPLPLEDFDPYRAAPGDPQCYGLTGPATLDDGERKNWLQAWSGTAGALLLSGERRLTEAATLLRCLVPLATPDRATAEARRGSCSATRSEAFGAVLSSTPPDATRLAATLVHELHHAKLAVVSEMMTLHHADGQARYFAPWRPDPRPYDGLLQGAYAHLALADFHQRRALDGSDRAHLDTDWSQFARYHAQVGAALPGLVGSAELTRPGRRLVEFMVDAHARMGEHPAPRAHAVRALEYVRTARRLWARRVPQELRAPLA
ncbi:HEXXH motif-containing putative peptide modification protein [Streptomyces gilvifuscus]|uniref:HEXXH motif-containing putative peptide modification protein n=1 Tax=Streptomyces gilvifuscus TaxID=1550617 RepID=A0ABT5G196_9ACTN|nr:HEXXH motif-containing putative peptide modification protein [Streptomyces gilvifuscus]MDC2958495.1 HEXXH motif-containing putative peptide modification protein [Streptomyces gilvifuscus]